MSFLPQETIRRKRDGAVLSADEIGAFIAALARDEIGEGQAAAFAMAIFFRGLDPRECAALTNAMARSGRIIDWRGAAPHGPIVDKHSTGGVGDLVSLVLAPAVAACGAYVPMISGRGLGHTGGTLDKLAAIPGYNTAPDEARLKEVVTRCGCAIIGQTEALAPADKRLYAIRDVTATVESIPLITASILSKKLAAGLDFLVMDVKTGSGAFMPTLAGARDLAACIVAVAGEAGLPTRALITDMDAPLAAAAGNALEMQVAIDLLRGSSEEPRLREVIVALGAEMLEGVGLAGDLGEARRRIETALASGAAAERFARMVEALGGPPDLLERPDAYLPHAAVVRAVAPPRAAYVAAIDARAIGLGVVGLGGGRRRAADAIDLSVGLTRLAPRGAQVGRDRPLCLVHAATEDAAMAAAAAVTAAYRLADSPPPPEGAVVMDRMTAASAPHAPVPGAGTSM
jgi:thymidine phosphorylase